MIDCFMAGSHSGICALGADPGYIFVTFLVLTCSIIVYTKLFKMETINLNQSIRPTFNLLRLTLGIVLIVAGLDKFTNLLTHWENYLHPGLAKMIPFAPHTFMMVVGVIVLAKPAIGGGEVILQRKINATAAAIDISNLSPGLYLVQIIQGEKPFVYKLEKNKGLFSIG